MGRLRNRRQVVVASASSKTKRKQSVRLMMQNYRSGLDKKAKTHYRWPRTVEAAKDAFADSSGKNKMFYMIACELFPFKQIIVPSDSESGGEEEDLEVDYDDPANEDVFGSSCSLEIHKRKRRYYTSQQTGKRIGIGRTCEDLSWRSQYNRRRVQNRSSLRPKRSGIVDQRLILDVINSVVQRFSNNDTEGGTGVEPLFVSPPPSVEAIPYPTPVSSPGDEVEDEDDENSDVDADVVGDSEETISVEEESAQDEIPSHDEEDDSEKEEHQSYKDNAELLFMRQQIIQPTHLGSATACSK